MRTPAKKRSFSRSVVRRRPAGPGDLHHLAEENAALHQALRVAEAERDRRGLLLEHAAVGLFLLDSLGFVLDASSAAAGLLGTTRRAMRSLPLVAWVEPTDQVAWNRHLLVANASPGHHAACEVRFRGRAGGAPIDAHVETIAGAGEGGLPGFWTAIIDAAEHRRMAAELAERTRREAALREEVHTAEARIARIAAVGSLLAESLDVDETASGVARLSVPDLAAFCAVDLLDERGHVQRRAARSIDEAAPLPVDPYAPRGSAWVVRSGEAVILREVSRADLLGLASTPDQLAALWGRVGAYVCLPLRARDRVLGALTLAQRARGGFRDEDLLLAGELARQAALSLDNALLYREAQEADRRKDEFLAMLGHELRNPLAAVVMAAGMLRLHARGNAGMLKATEVVERQSARLSRLVDDLLDVSRITHGKIALRREPLAIGDAVARAVESARPAIDARRHEIVVTVPGEPVLVSADPARLEQILVNLLVNAARYTEPGGRIEVEVVPEASAAVVRVRDTGAGIAPEMLARIFEPFTRVGADMDRGDRGLGIGLTLSRALSELHGGRLTAHSAGLGRGSEFTVRLPLDAAPRLAPQLGPGPAAPPRLAAPRRKLLLVEDEPDVADMMRERLEALGHDVRVASDGPEGVALALEHAPELLLIDLGLPGMSGYDVARRLRKEEALAGATFVALTGYGDETARRRSLQAGFDRHFAKPISEEALLELLGQG